jgi:uncharacterized protein (TIGR00251 family)
VTAYADGVLHVKLAAPPVDGAANEALILLLADVIGVGRRSIRIVSGQHSRLKRVEIADREQADVDARLSGFRD